MMLGCGYDCMNDTNLCFCSYKCKINAIQNGFVNNNDFESNLKLKVDVHNKIFNINQTSTNEQPTIIIGCGDTNCINKKNYHFCSRSCKNAAIQNSIITENEIDHEISNLKIKDNVHKGLFI
jgi:hypothetical protein